MYNKEVKSIALTASRPNEKPVVKMVDRWAKANNLSGTQATIQLITAGVESKESK